MKKVAVVTAIVALVACLACAGQWRWEESLSTGGRDTNGELMYGTEIMRIVANKGSRPVTTCSDSRSASPLATSCCRLDVISLKSIC